MFGRPGSIVKNPKVILRLLAEDEDQVVEEYGDFDLLNLQERIEWLVMWTYGIPAGKVINWCKDHDPGIMVTIVESGKKFPVFYGSMVDLSVEGQRVASARASRFISVMINRYGPSAACTVETTDGDVRRKLREAQTEPSHP